MALPLRDMLSKLFRWSKRIVREAIKNGMNDPSVKSSSLMALGICFTFVGYEYARAASITLLASKVSPPLRCDKSPFTQQSYCRKPI